MALPSGFVFDPQSDAFARDPYPTYAALRDHGQPWYFEGYDIWLLSRHADVQAAAVNPRLIRSLEGIATADEVAAQTQRDNWHDMPFHSRFVQFSMLNSDGEVHQRLRKMLFREFQNATLARLKAEIDSHVAGIIDGLGTEFDFIADLADHVPGHVIGRFLGVPDADCPILRVWSENIVQYFDINRTDDRKALAEATTAEFYHYLIALSDERRRRPKDDLISRLLVLWDAGELSEDEYISTCMLILMAGHGSTIDVLGTGLLALLKHPDQMRALRADPGLMPTAVQEMFRYDSPLPFFHRNATEDFDLNGFAVTKGMKLGLLYASANRDEEMFPDANRFDIRRTPNRHLSFGGGAHFCLGNHLARMEMEAVFAGLLARFPRLELAVEPEWKRGLSI
ncbi:MAG: cytochrome P450 [Asticcacaulis sp.]|nr:cytochrome P450 [Asticcacaulis sp.]